MTTVLAPKITLYFCMHRARLCLVDKEIRSPGFDTIFMMATMGNIASHITENDPDPRLFKSTEQV